MLRITYNPTIEPYGTYLIDLKNSVQGDETVILSIHEKFDYNPAVELANYHHFLELIIYSIGLSGRINDLSWGFQFGRFTRMRFIMPRLFFIDDYIELNNLDNVTIPLRIQLTTLKGFISPRVDIAWVGKVNGVFDLILLDFIGTTHTNLSGRVYVYQNAADSASLMVGVKSLEGSGISLLTVQTVTGSGVINQNNLLHPNPVLYRLSSTGAISSMFGTLSTKILDI